MFADYLIRDDEFGLSFIRAANGEHTEIVEQAHKVVGVGDIDGRKTFFQFSGDVAFAHQCLYDGGIMGKLFVLADEHAQLLVVDADVALYHLLGCFAAYDVVLDEVEYHVGVVHSGFTITFFCEAVVVIPGFHYFYQFVHTVVEWTGGGIVSEHLAHFFFRETYHLVEFRCERVVGSDIETTCEVVHCHGTYAGDETTLDAGIGSGFDFIEKSAQITFAMCFVRIAMQAFYIREDGIGEMVVFVDKEVNTLVGLITFCEQVFKLFDSSFFFVEFFLDAFGEIVGVNVTEVVEHCLAMRVQSLAVVVQFAYYSGEVEV